MSGEPQQSGTETESMIMDAPNTAVVSGEQAPEPDTKRTKVEGVSVDGTSAPKFTNSARPLNEYKTIGHMQERRNEILAYCEEMKVPITSQPAGLQLEYFDLLKMEDTKKQDNVKFINELREHGLPEDRIAIWTDMMTACDGNTRMQDLACEFVACSKKYGAKNDEDLRNANEEIKRSNKRALDAELQVSELQKKGMGGGVPQHQQKTSHITTTTTNNHNGATTTQTKQTKAVDNYYGAFPPKVNTIGKQRQTGGVDPDAWNAFFEHRKY
jgi:hypothetical protein